MIEIRRNKIRQIFAFLHQFGEFFAFCINLNQGIKDYSWACDAVEKFYYDKIPVYGFFEKIFMYF